jgi:hypothetical protein
MVVNLSCISNYPCAVELFSPFDFDVDVDDLLLCFKLLASMHRKRPGHVLTLCIISGFSIAD